MDREQQSTRPGATRATPAKSQSKAAKPKPAQSRAKGAGEPPATTAPDIMSRLPKTRPQRPNQRRRAPVAATPKATAPRAAAPSGKTAASPKQAKRPAAAASRRTAPRASAPAAQARRTSTASSQGAPGLPRLAIDGAAEAAKLPLKVTGRLTLRALDAVARGLRRR